MRFVQDVYNASDLLRCGSGSGSSGSGSGIQSASSSSSSANVLAVQAFYQPLNYPGAANNSDDAAGLWVALADGAGSLQFSSGAEHLSQWSAFEAADEAFGITGALGCADKMCVGDVAQRYFQPAENFNMSIYPDGWQQPQARPPAPPHAQEEGLLLPGFRPAVPRAAGAFADGLAIKAPMPLTLRQQLPVQFLNVTSSSDKRWWSYVVDFGCNFQVRHTTRALWQYLQVSFKSTETPRSFAKTGSGQTKITVVGNKKSVANRAGSMLASARRIGRLDGLCMSAQARPCAPTAP
jgi:hypothetical protein